ncbi:NAD(P)/FAD-dependent oxidoreductase [Actinomycetospora corticicola]|uniref:Cation diffusion facilitator CzcD-associated flavoprotein CzcO n=1 Tax=Actinomycetospora corticicola TaxID=663602 RepID=A0A7Y9E0T7_9PSEU|nr:NAD(P)/FAD-dependent oxidoreductase [Actinomycetospora corticicola]NYD38941.1 cation diffusion facilitator CzcD-associated flavoprotein CzcO [Actinomycetospora corticicola]
MFSEVVIVGSGFSGLGQALALREAGITDVVMLEKAPRGVGGTWRDNTYPGCACDIPSHMYSLSTDPNPDWSRSYSPQPEIHDYLERLADRHDLRRLIRFSTEMTGATWDEESRTWTVHTTTGEYRCRFLVSGMGALHLPSKPTLPGAERFRGETFHSAEWRHDVDLRGKRVAVVGTGASAIQFVPQIAPLVSQLTLFQRTPAWVLPKGDHPIGTWRKRLFEKAPLIQKAYRGALYAGLESRAIGFMSRPELLRPAEWIARKHIERSISDPALVDRLTPRYSLGCKRVLVSNDYYPALARPNVDVVASGIAEVTEHGVVDHDGVEHPADVIIYGTGFHVTDSMDGLEITGRDGRTLRSAWAEHGMRTHYGITVTDFPNLFFLLGPNTGLGHNSVVFMIECQARYVAQAISAVHGYGCSGLDVRAEVMQRSDAAVMQRLEKGIWTRGGCTSWYLDAAGNNRTIWPGFTLRYWAETRRFRPEDYEFFGRSSDFAVPTTGAADSTGRAPVPAPV